MPSLICSSQYTVDSQILRKSAQTLGWETLRLDGDIIPEWFDPPDTEIAFFFTAPKAFEIARQFGRLLLGCNADWTVSLPDEFLKRELVQTSLSEALGISTPRFVKHSVSKAFPAAVYDAIHLAQATKSVHPDSLVHVGEPVKWESEFRCFVCQGSVVAISPYVYERQVVPDYDSFPSVPQAEIDVVRIFAESVVRHPDVACPAAFVLDVGIIQKHGWAVVECNECWAAGIYACEPALVLKTLTFANVEIDAMTTWDFQKHYNSACAIKDQ